MAMADKTVTLKMQGSVTLGAFAIAVANLSKLVSELSTEAKARGMKWDITALEAGSAELTARADLGDSFTEDQADVVATSFLKIGQELAEHGPLSQYRSRIRKPALALGEIAKLGVEEVVFETPEADAVVRPEPLQVAVPASAGTIAFPVPAHGTVTGRVQALSNRGGLRFTLYEAISDRAVSCYLARGGEDVMIDIWGRLATIEGVVSRDPATGRPIAVRQIRDVQTHDECSPDAYKAARGAVVPMPGSDLPEDVIRRLRDAN